MPDTPTLADFRVGTHVFDLNEETFSKAIAQLHTLGFVWDDAYITKPTTYDSQFPRVRVALSSGQLRRTSMRFYLSLPLSLLNPPPTTLLHW